MVIGIRGESGVGKSTLALILTYVLNTPTDPNLFDFLRYKREADHGFIQGKWRTANFASTLKVAMATLYGVDYKDYEEGKFKDISTGIEVWYLKYKIGEGYGENNSVIIDSYNTEEKAESALTMFKRASSLKEENLYLESKILTWRDTLNAGAKGLHLLLGQDITLQAYQHRFNSATEHLVMGDLRKPREIDLIQKNGGIIIWLKRDFIYKATRKEVRAFYQEKGYFYNLAKPSSPLLETDQYMIEELADFNIPIGIDCRPKPNPADRWLDGDERHDFELVNPVDHLVGGNSLNDLLQEVIKLAPSITDKLCKNEA